MLTVRILFAFACYPRFLCRNHILHSHWTYKSCTARLIHSHLLSQFILKMNIYVCVCLFLSSSHSHIDYKAYVVTETCTQIWVQLLPCKHNLPQQHLEIQTQVAIEEMIIFLLLSLSDILIHAESLSVSRLPPPQHIPTSSLSVVDADMSHLEALPYMCRIDISLLTFPFFPGGLIVKLL